MIYINIRNWNHEPDLGQHFKIIIPSNAIPKSAHIDVKFYIIIKL